MACKGLTKILGQLAPWANSHAFVSLAKRTLEPASVRHLTNASHSASVVVSFVRTKLRGVAMRDKAEIASSRQLCGLVFRPTS